MVRTKFHVNTKNTIFSILPSIPEGRTTDDTRCRSTNFDKQQISLQLFNMDIIS